MLQQNTRHSVIFPEYTWRSTVTNAHTDGKSDTVVGVDSFEAIQLDAHLYLLIYFIDPVRVIYATQTTTTKELNYK